MTLSVSSLASKEDVEAQGRIADRRSVRYNFVLAGRNALKTRGCRLIKEDNYLWDRDWTVVIILGPFAPTHTLPTPL